MRIDICPDCQMNLFNGVHHEGDQKFHDQKVKERMNQALKEYFSKPHPTPQDTLQSGAREFGPEFLYASIYKRSNGLCRAEASPSQLTMDPETDVEIKYIKYSAYAALNEENEELQRDRDALDQAHDITRAKLKETTHALEIMKAAYDIAHNQAIENGCKFVQLSKEAQKYRNDMSNLYKEVDRERNKLTAELKEARAVIDKTSFNSPGDGYSYYKIRESEYDALVAERDRLKVALRLARSEASWPLVKKIIDTALEGNSGN